MQRSGKCSFLQNEKTYNAVYYIAGNVGRGRLMAQFESSRRARVGIAQVHGSSSVVTLDTPYNVNITAKNEKNYAHPRRYALVAASIKT